ncbi:MAG: hypothetical protein UY39_C0059G0004 [Candidatus Kaiserbacteria bacterium GW2011_GWC2_49_12]|uniref:MgtC/SapB/SrpB/YhiD N-terminal domain-containing protein n=3 Tax=Candidatus Kaiseribacteriota TaxID=1752734 RepID=A0A0G1ZBP8_9BACT|nr:MAG: hypothetical protein UY39_C0059G0004 [Candidatus Kaiserbacteria bacterium GW2011_GWC2_49_12]KKW16584.1 MAG: hypothetical protein UY57_C0037G0005 [Candidatus Kaiserbacteria bacterium GW2011_GWB1_50_17]OGG87295.1 MAG: hypothetical protein A3H15_03030 [Candidatus Kaiserbacteria bacterium RIFCSPLOWO2_12_FULL_50_28]HCM43788.1 hypothetical protein [Candidatus Kaiserbacteria bacterium]
MLSPEHFIDTNVIIISKLALAMLLGAVIGTERAIFARQTAGTRTFGLVALGACLFIVMANYVSLSFVGVVGFDPMRTAAAVITGVGFLGAGLIIFRGDTLHGITTAAGLWIVSGIGMAVGFGMYAVAIFATFLTLLMFTVMWYVENRFKHWFEEVNHDSAVHTGS